MRNVASLIPKQGLRKQVGARPSNSSNLAVASPMTRRCDVSSNRSYSGVSSKRLPVVMKQSVRRYLMPGFENTRCHGLDQPAEDLVGPLGIGPQVVVLVDRVQLGPHMPHGDPATS